MRRIGNDEYMKLRAGGEVIEQDSHGEKVVGLPDGTILKFFRRKRLISSALLYPYAQRFSDNCAKLRELDIPSPVVISVFHLPHPSRDVVHYQALEGVTIRSLRRHGVVHGTSIDALRREIGAFVSALHALGVYFRSLHLGNIVYTPDGKFGLIDVSDLSVKKRPLRSSERARNFHHLCRYAEEVAWLMEGADFELGYGAHPALQEIRRTVIPACTGSKSPSTST